MAYNKNALIRYKTIDKCLQNRYRKWTLDDLIEACSDALYEYEGKMMNVSKRTIQLDIQTMRSDKLGYNAPIIVVDKKYYTYEDPEYSIMNVGISSQDLKKISQSVAFLSQFKGFSHFNALQEVVQKLEDHIYSHQTNTQPVIDFEKNDHLKGLEFLDSLHKHILQHHSILITYQSFRNRYPNTFVFYPYLLKEYRNRWFVIGSRTDGKNIVNLALDRIISIKKSHKPFMSCQIDLKKYYDVAIGVTVQPNKKPENVKLFVNREMAPYVETKPLHHSQQTLERNQYGVVIGLQVQLNFELEKAILSFGDHMQVIAPQRLKKNIYKRLNNAIDLYNSNISKESINRIVSKLNYKSCTVINYIYTKRDMRNISKLIHNYVKNKTEIVPIDLSNDEHIKQIILNVNIELIQKYLKTSTIKGITFYPKSPRKDWHQRIEMKETDYIIQIYLSERKQILPKMKVIAGTHKKRLSPDKINIILDNSIPVECRTQFGGILIIKPYSLQQLQRHTEKGSAYIEILLSE